MRATLLGMVGWTLLAMTGRAADFSVQSGPARVHLLELFTSEGCSSCPPADRWLSTLRQSPRLWKEVVPVAFHVDYWDYLGWKDPLASRAASERQRAYAAAWGTRSVYTPGFVLDGREWRERSLEALPSAPVEAGMLSATLAPTGAAVISYLPARSGGSWEAHAALLGQDLHIDVKGGENGGNRLAHDFVALAHLNKGMSADGRGFRATLQLPARTAGGAFAVWVTALGRTEPAQAAGGGW